MNSSRSRFSRRGFLKSSALVTAGLSLPAWYLEEMRAYAAPAPTRSPNDRLRIALIGCGGMGRGNAGDVQRFGDITVVCDVDERQMAEAAKQFTKDGKAPEKVGDFRKVVTRADVDAVITATPDHWHTLINIAAARAGKDIYSQKPLTLCIDEGKRLVKEVRKSKVVFQTGSQQRSDSKFRLACELVRNGRIGKIQHVIVGLPTGPREGPFKPEPVPAGLNWDYYVGQAPLFDYNGHNAHWNFRWWWRFSGGQMTDWGAHHNDIAQWALGTERSGPVEVQGKSLVDMIPGGYDAASKYRVEFKYASGITMTVVDESTVTDRNVVGGGKSTPNGIQFLGSDGWIYVARGDIKASKDEMLQTPLPANATRLYKSHDHMADFIECVRSRKQPICDVEIGHRSISVAHLGTTSIRMGGAALKWDPAKEQFTGANAKDANPWLAREMRKPYDYGFIA